MKALLENHRVLLVGGAGGVGKTTLAATLGIQLAEQGYRTAVLTVDPAKRLAQALGFRTFEAEVQRIEVPNAKGELFASMLETQRYFDHIITQYAKSESQKKKVLEHPIYRTMVDSLGGTQEYAAMERLLEFAESDRFEKIVVDTPPSQNAADLLSAPQRLADFMDNSVLKWFQATTSATGKIFKRGTQAAMKVLQTLFGADFFQSFSTLLDNFDGLQEGFRQRHLQVLDLLRSDQTAFLLVTRATEARFDEAKQLLTTLQEQQIALKAVIANRLEPSPPPIAPSSLTDEQRNQIEPLFHYLTEISRHQQQVLGQFRNLVGKTPVFPMNRFEEPLHEIGALSRFGKTLLEA